MSLSLTPEERSERARIGAHALHAKRDPKETTTSARHAFLQKFLAEVDPNLPEDERIRRAKHAMQAFLSKKSLEALRARRLGSIAPTPETVALVSQWLTQGIQEDSYAAS